MPATRTPPFDPDFRAPDFDLPGVDGGRHSLATARGPKGLLVVFLCNHCPFVQAIAEPLARDAGRLIDEGIGVIGVMPNDTVAYPEDGFDKMVVYARDWGLPFPYVHDETQAVAKAYGAVCTPDFFGFNADLMLRFRGRFDDAGGPQGDHADAKPELLAAMRHVAATGDAPPAQTPSMGCSIKWRERT